jgi:hypothetical protein
MVAVQGNLGVIFKDPVVGNLRRWQVAMVVDNGHSGRKIMVQQPGRFGLEEKILA